MMLTDGATLASIETCTAVDVVLAARSSVATATIAYEPALASCHVAGKGGLVDRPTRVPPLSLSLYSTAETNPSASLATAVRFTGDPLANRDPSSGEVIVTIGAWFAGPTVIAAARDCASRPRSSVARAVIICGPAVGCDSVTVQGSVNAVPTDVPLSKNSTLAIDPCVLIASAFSTSAAPASTTEQASGPLTTTSGASPMVIPTDAETVAAPLSSIARAAIAWSPASAPVQEMANGAAVAAPTTAVPSRNSTRTTLPSPSLAAAATAIVDPSP